VGSVPLRIPKLWQGSYFPSLLEPRRMAEKALVSVVHEAYVQGPHRLEQPQSPPVPHVRRGLWCCVDHIGPTALYP